MKLLLTSSGISNPSIYDVLVDLLGKPLPSPAPSSFPPRPASLPCRSAYHGAGHSTSIERSSFEYRYLPALPVPRPTRTRNLLLRRHFRNVAGQCWMWPDVTLGRVADSWTWPAIAQNLGAVGSPLGSPKHRQQPNVRMLRIGQRQRPSGMAWPRVICRESVVSPIPQ
jgi:hypothetical protein